MRGLEREPDAWQKPAQIIPLGAKVSEIINLAAFAAHDAIRHREQPVAVKPAKRGARRKAG